MRSPISEAIAPGTRGEGFERRLYVALGIDPTRFDLEVGTLLRQLAAEAERPCSGRSRPDAEAHEARMRAAIRAAGLARLCLFDPSGGEEGREGRELAYRVAVVRAALAGPPDERGRTDSVVSAFARSGPCSEAGPAVLDRARECVDRAWNAAPAAVVSLTTCGVEGWIEASRRLVGARIWRADRRTGRVWPGEEAVWLMWPLAARDLLRESGKSGAPDDLAVELAVLGLIRARATEPLPGATYWRVSASGRAGPFKAVAWTRPECWPECSAWPRASLSTRPWTASEGSDDGSRAA